MKIEDEISSQKYQLTRRGFLDAVYNRIHIVHFYPTNMQQARVIPLSVLDKYGRVMVALGISTYVPKERQPLSLVHEMIHVDRSSWEKLENQPRHKIKKIMSEEEDLTEKAAKVFYDEHQRLAAVALNHVWLRREELPIE